MPHDGAYIFSEGFVNLSYTSAFDNQNGEGVYIHNDGGTDGISIYKGSFNNNESEGLQLDSNGPISIKNVDAIGNNDYGIYVTGDATTTTVSLNSVNAAWNALDGVRLANVADVTVSLSNFVANGIPGFDSDGLYILSNSSNVVTISKSTFMSNFGNGIELFNVGSYTLTSSIALGNDVDGDNTASQVDVYVH